MTFAQAAHELRQLSTRMFPPGHPSKPYPPTVRAIYAGLHAVAKSARQHYASRGIGKRIWGGGGFFTAGTETDEGSNLPKFVHPTTIKGSGNSFEAGIIVSGVPRLIESGGRTKEHAIFPRTAVMTKTRNLTFAQMARFRVHRGTRVLMERSYSKELIDKMDRVYQKKLKLQDGSYRRIVLRHTSQIPRRNVVRPLLDRSSNLFAMYIDNAIQAEIKRGPLHG